MLAQSLSATLLLPSLRSAPLDSPELVRITPRPVPRSEPVLLPWTAPVVSLDPASVAAVFDEPVDDIRYGASVAYFAELAAYAGELGATCRALGLSCAAGLAFPRPALRSAVACTHRA